MINKKIVVMRKKSESSSYSKVMFDKNFIIELAKLRGRNMELLFLVINDLIEFNSNKFEITRGFKDSAMQNLKMNSNGISINLVKLSEGNVIKRIKAHTYLYNPYLFFYGDKEHESKCQCDWDIAIKLVRRRTVTA